MAFENYQDMRAGDVIECFRVEAGEAHTLAADAHDWLPELAHDMCGARLQVHRAQLRVGELIRHELAEIFARGETGDPALEHVGVTVLEVADVAGPAASPPLMCAPSLDGRERRAARRRLTAAASYHPRPRCAAARPEIHARAALPPRHGPRLCRPCRSSSCKDPDGRARSGAHDPEGQSMTAMARDASTAGSCSTSRWA